MENDYWEHQRPGTKQIVCAWAIVLALALLFRVVELLSPGQPALFRLQDNQIAQTEEAIVEEIEPWERDLPRRSRTLRRQDQWLTRIDP